MMAKRQFKTGAQDLYRPQITTIPLRFTYEPEAPPMKNIETTVISPSCSATVRHCPRPRNSPDIPTSRLQCGTRTSG